MRRTGTEPTFGYADLTSPLQVLGHPMKELMEIARLRAEGARRLEAIARESGANSILYRCCRELWFEREAGTDLSVIAGDWKNAITLLQLGLHVLVHGPEVLKKDGLAIDDVVKLLGAV
jgi:hypothetical protein